MRYITSPNTKAIDAVKYLLSRGVGDSGLNAPAYLIHRLIDDKGYITTFENLFKPDSMDYSQASNNLPFSITEALVKNKNYLARHPNTDSMNGGVEIPRLLFNYKFMEFDQEERQWDDYNVSKTAINDLLTRGIDPSSETSVFLKTLNEDISMSKYYKYPPLSHGVLYDAMRQLELYSSSFSFVVNGSIAMDVGDVIAINENGSNGAKESQFTGKWVITDIRHSFKKGIFSDYITVCRRFSKIHIPAYDRTKS